ncbi:hypothetical protein JZ751_017602 [Albula glossodonta]|uniref:E3 ubiquitin-protein ligase makorin-2 n=1 Tax=Albula glossodonta TaxID=121402 RepID=A0A8T2PLL8_9TELE|nr:hypothetical protein JZ751_017602 [Albula glossodonta]
MTTKQVTCRYFLHGVCREGSRCMFSHDLSTSKPSTICKFYQKGVCAYGDRCRTGSAASAAAAAVPGNCPPANSGRRGKKPLVLRDRALGSASEGRPLQYSGEGAELQQPDAWEYRSDAAQAKPHSYLDAIRAGLESGGSAAGPSSFPNAPQLCPYAAAGQCHYGSSCTYLHGDMCEICRLQVLHPHDPEQRRAHEKLDMEKAFAAQHSQDKVCSICMEVVYEKAVPSERRFGILSSCCHTYCLSCIRQWRCAKQSCPECRVVSEFVIPSVYWVEDQQEKNRLIEEFKAGVSKKACKYFDQGRGTCPFGGKCFYMHAYPDGTRAEPDKPRKQLSSEGSVREREHRGVPQYEDEVSELGELFMQLSGAGSGASEDTGVTAPY